MHGSRRRRRWQRGAKQLTRGSNLNCIKVEKLRNHSSSRKRAKENLRQPAGDTELRRTKQWLSLRAALVVHGRELNARSPVRHNAGGGRQSAVHNIVSILIDKLMAPCAPQRDSSTPCGLLGLNILIIQWLGTNCCRVVIELEPIRRAIERLEASSTVALANLW